MRTRRWQTAGFPRKRPGHEKTPGVARIAGADGLGVSGIGLVPEALRVRLRKAEERQSRPAHRARRHNHRHVGGGIPHCASARYAALGNGRHSRRDDPARRHHQLSGDSATNLAEPAGRDRIQASDVTYLALSHYHYDHSANANAFAGAMWLVQKPERDVMFSGTLGPSSPNSPTAETTAARFAALQNSKTTLLDGDHDVFGDGSVVIISTPGHTPGHQSLLVNLPKTGAILLSGDLYHYPAE